MISILVSQPVKTYAYGLDTLAKTWYHLRTPQKPYHSLVDRPGSLALKGNGYSISDVEAPAMLLKKQTHLTGVWTTELDFHPSTENEEAGTAVFWSCFAYAAIVVRKGHKENERSVILRWTDPDCEEYKVSRCLNEFCCLG
jgi:beta-xylosidase